MDIIVLSLGSYLFGNINPAISMTQIKKGIDIRTVGRQNAGATNAALTLGFKFGLLIALLDILKGALPVLMARLLYPDNDAIWFLFGVMVMLGHMFPVFHQFKGGKGIASLIGVLVTAAPLFGSTLLLVSIGLLLTTKYITISSVTAVIVTPVYVFISPYSNNAGWLMLGFMGISLFKQRKNIADIWHGREVSLRQILKKIEK